jgi:hypothetical protein
MKKTKRRLLWITLFCFLYLPSVEANFWGDIVKSVEEIKEATETVVKEIIPGQESTEDNAQPPGKHNADVDLVRLTQKELKRIGYEVSVDGAYGPGTRKAILQFESDNGLKVTGNVSPQLLSKLKGAKSEVSVVKNTPEAAKKTNADSTGEDSQQSADKQTIASSTQPNSGEIVRPLKLQLANGNIVYKKSDSETKRLTDFLIINYRPETIAPPPDWFSKQPCNPKCPEGFKAPGELITFVIAHMAEAELSRYATKNSNGTLAWKNATDEFKLRRDIEELTNEFLPQIIKTAKKHDKPHNVVITQNRGLPEYDFSNQAYSFQYYDVAPFSGHKDAFYSSVSLTGKSSPKKSYPIYLENYKPIEQLAIPPSQAEALRVKLIGKKNSSGSVSKKSANLKWAWEITLNGIEKVMGREAIIGKVNKVTIYRLDDKDLANPLLTLPKESHYTDEHLLAEKQWIAQQKAKEKEVARIEKLERLEPTSYMTLAAMYAKTSPNGVDDLATRMGKLRFSNDGFENKKIASQVTKDIQALSEKTNIDKPFWVTGTVRFKAYDFSDDSITVHSVRDSKYKADDLEKEISRLFGLSVKVVNAKYYPPENVARRIEEERGIRARVDFPARLLVKVVKAEGKYLYAELMEFEIVDGDPAILDTKKVIWNSQNVNG